MRALAILIVLAGVARADTKFPKLDDLPKLVLARPSIAKVAQSTALNADGYKLHVAKKLADAAVKYKAAVVADPGNLLARYNLASVFVSSGDRASGIAILAAFAIPDCRACVGILVHSKTDAEWAAVRDDPAFVAIVKDAKADTIDQPKLAKLVATIVETVDDPAPHAAKALAAYIHPRLPVHVMLSGTGVTLLETADTLERWAFDANAQKNPIIRSGGLSRCTNNCCTFGGSGSRSDTTWELDQVCFAGVGGELFLDSIQFSSYMSSLPHP